MTTKKIFSKNSNTQFSRQARNDSAWVIYSLSKTSIDSINKLTYIKANK